MTDINLIGIREHRVSMDRHRGQAGTAGGPGGNAAPAQNIGNGMCGNFEPPGNPMR